MPSLAIAAPTRLLATSPSTGDSLWWAHLPQKKRVLEQHAKRSQEKWHRHQLLASDLLIFSGQELPPDLIRDLGPGPEEPTIDLDDSS